MSQDIPSGHQPAAVRGWFSRERVITLVLVAITAIVFYLCYLLTVPFLPALAWALALAIIVHPVHQWLTRWLPGRTFAAATAVVLVAVVIIVPVSFVTRHLVVEADNALNLMQERLESGEWREQLQEHPRLRSIISWIEKQFELHTSEQAETSKTESSDAELANQSRFEVAASNRRPLHAAATAVAQGVGTALTNSAWFGMQLFITLLALFFFFRDRHRVLAVVRSLMPLSERETDQVFARIDETIHATIYGSVAVALIQGTMGGLMFWWLGLPSPVLWGGVMALLAVVPVLGTFVVWAPTAVYLALQGDWFRALTLTAWGAIAIALIDNALTPFLVGKRLQFHTLLVFIAIVGGLATFGAAGVILGPLLLTIADALLHIWRQRTAFGGTVEAACQEAGLVSSETPLSAGR